MRGLLVDNDQLLLDSLRLAIETRHNDLEVDVACSEREAILLAEVTEYDLILLDWWLSDESAERCFEHLRELSPGARIVVMSGDDSAALIHRVLDLGALGFIRKSAANIGVLRDAIDIVRQGGIYLPQQMGDAASVSPSVRPHWVGRELAACFPQLTPRQLDVLRVMLRGASDKIIARELDIALCTVKTHVQEVFRRIDVTCRAEAVAMAARLGCRVD